MTLPEYPVELESWWLRRLQAQTGQRAPEKSLPRIEPAIRALSDSFTRNRADAFAVSYDDPALRLAYGIFFFPQTHVRIRIILDELVRVRQWTLPPDGTRRILDLGAGLGAAGHAAATHPALAHPRMELTTVESRPGNLALQQRFLRENLPATVRLLTHAADMRDVTTWAPRRNYRWDLILVSLSMNEAFYDRPASEAADWLRQAAAHLTPHGLLLIMEPALHATATALHRLRDHLLTHHPALHLWAPCLHRQPCPALAGGAFCCHEARAWNPPAALRLLNKTLHREIETLKFSFLVLGRQAPPALPSTPAACRMVSPVGKSPGRYHFHGCAADGTIATYDLLLRHLDTAAKAAWWRTERGTVLRDLHLTPLGTPGNYRIQPPPAGLSSGTPLP